jgi:MoaA/NifB/PqqE/SkfB family radical SAM enzyme
MKITNLSIDASTVCQLKCPECSNTKGIIKNGIIGSGYLTFSDFKSLIQGNPEIKKIELSNWGEIFLNPELKSILKYSFQNGIKLSAGNGVNFNDISESIIESLVKYKFGYINFSIDGASQETYSIYRVNGQYAEVLTNIEKLNFYKKKYRSSLPKLSWQFIVFGHNEHEILTAKKISHELNMVFVPKLNFSSFSPVTNAEQVKREAGLVAVTRTEYKKLTKKDYKRPCCQLWYSPQVSWDGKVLGCCVNKWKSYGNAFSDGLNSVLENDLYLKTLDILRGLKTIDDSIPCYSCPTFKKIEDTPITQEEIKAYSNFIHPAEQETGKIQK